MKIDSLHAEAVLEVATRLAAAYVGTGTTATGDIGVFAKLARELVEASVREGGILAAQEEP